LLTDKWKHRQAAEQKMMKTRLADLRRARR
jgi:hypothetical protein